MSALGASQVSQDGRMTGMFIELDSRCVRGFITPILQRRKVTQVQLSHER